MTSATKSPRQEPATFYLAAINLQRAGKVGISVRKTKSLSNGEGSTLYIQVHKVQYLRCNSVPTYLMY